LYERAAREGADVLEEYEGMERAAQLLPNARFIGLPGLNHVQGAGASTQLLPELIAFWDAVP